MAQRIDNLLKVGPLPDSAIKDILTIQEVLEELWTMFKDWADSYPKWLIVSVIDGEITQPEHYECMKKLETEKIQMTMAKQQIDTILSKCLSYREKVEQQRETLKQRKFIKQHIMDNRATLITFKNQYVMLSEKQVLNSATPNNSKMTQKQLSELFSTTKAKATALTLLLPRLLSLALESKKLVERCKVEIASLERLNKQTPGTQQQDASAAQITALRENISAMDKERESANAEIFRIEKEFTETILTINELIDAFTESLGELPSISNQMIEEIYESAKKGNPIILIKR